jgi:glucose-1-phosphate cytidylyltransferase
MKVVILAGGRGSRLSEETDVRPKPMIEIGGRPILWHIMKIYSYYGFNEFVICLGYMGYYVKEYFANYFLHQSDITIDLKSNHTEVHQSKAESWRITLIDTGVDTMTGGRIKRIQSYVGDETFMLTYGDGLANLDLNDLLEFHRKKGRYATLTSVMPPGRFGALESDDNDNVLSFREKPKGDGAWINGGFFVLEPQIFNYITKGDETVWEQEPLETLAREKQLVRYRHYDFWRGMDTLRDRMELERMWNSGKAPWKIWND